MAMHTELWFPSVIWSSVIHVVDNDEVKAFAYKLQSTDQGRIVSNHGGFQSQDLNISQCTAIDRLVKLLNEEMNTCANQVGMKDLEIQNLWININPPGSYNELHNHLGSVLSGVYYVDASSDQGNIQFDRSDGAEYHIPDNIGKTTYYTSSRATYAGKTNALYIFPGWLKHSVQVNKSNTDRISISFNYGEKR